jgi:kynureninase
MPSFEISSAFAQQLDQQDALRALRNEFHIPQQNGKPVIYLCGNSLGLQPKSAVEFLQQELDDWRNLGVEGHLHGRNPWYYYHHFGREQLAALCGADTSEVVAMNALTVNLHLLMTSFFKPQGRRRKILLEHDAFPSDQYAVAAQLQSHGLDPKECFVEVHPASGAHTISTEQIVSAIETLGDELALVMFSGVNFYTGQWFDIPAITQAAHRAGAMAGFDLAHAIGNVPLQLHDWDVDFAAWCTYKYLNAGPGAVGGIFVHEKHNNDVPPFRLSGWWGHDEQNRFLMEKDFRAMPGAAGWQLSNAPVLSMAVLRASLEIFHRAGMQALRDKSLLLTGYLAFLINDAIQHHGFDAQIITPADSTQRGCQLSILTGANGKLVFDRLSSRGVIADWRNPDVIRIAPVPLYNSFEDVLQFYQRLIES